MTSVRRSHAIIIQSLILMPLLAAIPGLVLAQEGSAGIPENSHSKSYGGGWECDREYRAVDETCVAVIVPADAYPTSSISSGTAWECNRGFRRTDATGFRQFDATCVAIAVPANGYLVDASYGPGWECDRGYSVVDGACAAIMMPENAHIDFSGNDWDLQPPFSKAAGKTHLILGIREL